MSDCIIETKGLTKRYGDQVSVSNLDLHVRKGRIYGLLGRNGAGKTTTMKMLLGLTAPTSGSVSIFGRPLKENEKGILPRIGSLIESPGFYPNLTGTENLQIFARLRGLKSPNYIKSALELVNLPYRDKKRYAQYSLGMKQRLAIALAVMHNPELLILDEPINGLDPIGIAAQIWLALQEITGRELPAKTPAVVTVGRFQAGQAPNIIPDEAVLEGTVRTFDRAVTARIMERIRQLSEGIASAFRGSAQMEELASAPPLQNDPALTEDMAALAEALLGREKVYRLKEGGMGSEDFASYTYELPCAYLLLGAGVPQEAPRYGQPMHNPKVVFNEDVLPLGAALLTAGAMHRLER